METIKSTSLCFPRQQQLAPFKPFKP
jgi:hypothetical protein